MRTRGPWDIAWKARSTKNSHIAYLVLNGTDTKWFLLPMAMYTSCALLPEMLAPWTSAGSLNQYMTQSTECIYSISIKFGRKVASKSFPRMDKEDSYILLDPGTYRSCC